MSRIVCKKIEKKIQEEEEDFIHNGAFSTLDSTLLIKVSPYKKERKPASISKGEELQQAKIIKQQWRIVRKVTWGYQTLSIS